jgi:Carboxypeptidase regulatory-like domain
MLSSSGIKTWKQWLFAVVMTLLMLPAAWAHANGTVSGQVRDPITLEPIAGVTVSTKGARSVVTDAGGLFTLTGVKQKARILVNFSKAGLAPTQITTSLVDKPTRIKHRDDDEDDEDDHHGGRKLQSVTIVQTMIASGTKQSFNTAGAIVLEQNGSKVTFSANSLTATGTVDITITPIDVSTNALQAAPGGLLGRTIAGGIVSLDSFSMADFTLSQGGRRVNLKRGSTAVIELLLPASTRLTNGQVTPMWYFDTQRGLWVEEGTGVVQASSAIAGRLAVVATVRHFTYWNSDQAAPGSAAITGKVVDKNGVGIPNASVEGWGSDYAGHSYAVRTDANGVYCILGRIGSTTALTGSSSFGGVLVSSFPALNVTTANTPSTCPSAGPAVANIVLPTALSCVSGVVRDAANLPVAGVTVYSSTGGSAVTNATGSYQFAAPEVTSVRVFAAGYGTMMVTTPVSGAPCATANLRPPVTGTTACVTGLIYQCNTSTVSPGSIASYFGPGRVELGVSTPADANGRYCLEGLPTNTTVEIGILSGSGDRMVTTAGSGTCATNSCVAAPALIAFTSACGEN